MYADRLDQEAKRPIEERLSGNRIAGSGRRGNSSGKRQREDNEKWEHDLFEEIERQVPKHSINVDDLRWKLQRKSIRKAPQPERESALGGARNLREKLSGTSHSRPDEMETLQQKPKPSVVDRLTGKSVTTKDPELDWKRVGGLVYKRKLQQKAESVDDFLHSLGLEKYSITFQAEEVDMTTLVQMNDNDLKAMGLPMGPRKKILVALESVVQHQV